MTALRGRARGRSIAREGPNDPLATYKLVWRHPDFTVGLDGFREWSFILGSAMGPGIE